MASPHQFENDLRDRRTLRGWSQEELAHRSKLSRAGVSAIETGRLIPSAAAALALAAALECRGEDVFHLRGAGTGPPGGAGAPGGEGGRYWAAEVDGVVRLYPAESIPLGVIPHDRIAD